MQDNVRNPERGEIKQSVCKHCGFSAEEHPVRHQIDGKYAYCGTFEPVAESVSTGEPGTGFYRSASLQESIAQDEAERAARPSGPSAQGTVQSFPDPQNRTMCSADIGKVVTVDASPETSAEQMSDAHMYLKARAAVRKANDPAAPQPVPRADGPEYPIVGPEDGFPCCEHCAKHPGSQWTLKVSHPVSGDAPKVEELMRLIELKHFPNLKKATKGEAEIARMRLKMIVEDVLATLRPYFPPASQTNTLFQKVITFLESCRDKAKAECGIYLTANHFETILESLKLATPASTARKPKEKNDN